ncbi:uncharacterized protein BDR25DRAFT_376865 [Lindgomyces ingoldianus]|uniref:Uncharacterized protein n=1 Tax=Lindgomyces ingoldianus TaxID=673940 RepID=A0ACB6QIF8_9PLEO|nr:uncharacterized protein BDR25DRAFT_376865 [Lindgomyces ingoldianus]KAF2466734.1 hypothetical protein BDR25DRAFT_376865 [Lindgomyces ingoldianus]
MQPPANNLVAAWVQASQTPFNTRTIDQDQSGKFNIGYQLTYTNNICDTASDRQEEECALDCHADNVVMSKTKTHIIAGVNFARQSNIHLIIRDTGHGFMAWLIGRESLATNTHAFQDVKSVDKYTVPGPGTAAR